MISNKQEYQEYLQADKLAFGNYEGGLLRRIFFHDTYFLYAFLKSLRKVEYLNNKKRNIFEHLQYVLAFYRYKKLGFKLHLSIPLNVLGPGARIHHIGFLVINPGARTGSGCTFQPGVVIGQKDSPENVPTVGNNVYFGPGCQVIGKVLIGNNVVIAPNSVVIKDVPDDCVVSGVPAKIIKQNGVKVLSR